MQTELTTLVIFTCEGREHLLEKTYRSFLEKCDFKFSKTILAIDGTINADSITKINADLVIYNYKRVGYITSIINAIMHIDTPYFFWLEDDFIFNQKVPVDYMRRVMDNDTGWAGIFLSRSAPLTAAEKKHHYFDDLYTPDFGFSVSPSLCQTKYINNAFKALVAYPKNDSTKHFGFEPFIDSFFVQNNLKYALLDPGTIAHVQHIGNIESTAREYHMINAIDKELTSIDKKFISGLGKERVITLYNKVAMLPKLWLSVITLSVNLFRDRRSYDFSFRIYIAYLRKFKF